MGQILTILVLDIVAAPFEADLAVAELRGVSMMLAQVARIS